VVVALDEVGDEVGDEVVAEVGAGNKSNKEEIRIRNHQATARIRTAIH
jgi:hypothetical protein